jgi:phospholipid N-methyltransferase
MATKRRPAGTEESAEVLLEHVNEKAAQQRMAAKYKSEPLVEIAISPLYANEFSNNMPIVLNGVRINIPVNGKVYKIPYSFALEVRNRIAAVDEKAKKLNRLSDVPNNFERSPGELKLFR